MTKPREDFLGPITVLDKNLSGDITASGAKISDVANPTVATDVATKDYVDSSAAAGTLANVLNFGNTTGGHNIEITSGDSITSAGGDVLLATTQSGGSAGTISIRPSAGTGVNGGSVNIYAGFSDTGSGGAIISSAGVGASGGFVIINGGNGTVTDGGFTQITGGNGVVNGGSLFLIGGQGTTGFGGHLNFLSGTGGPGGGNANLIAGGSSDVGGFGGHVNLNGGSNASAGSTGGNITAIAGAGTTFGGSAYLWAGTSSAGTGGAVSIIAGDGATHGGDVGITSGASNLGSGTITIKGANSGGAHGGFILIESGQAPGGGGDIDIRTPAAIGSRAGTINLTTGGGPAGGAGLINITTGISSGATGHNININGGDGSAGGAADININAGNYTNAAGSAPGGNITITAGSTAATFMPGVGGIVNIFGGDSLTANNGGAINIIAGDAQNGFVGGNVTISSGDNPPAVDSHIYLQNGGVNTVTIGRLVAPATTGISINGTVQSPSETINYWGSTTRFMTSGTDTTTFNYIQFGPDLDGKVSSFNGKDMYLMSGNGININDNGRNLILDTGMSGGGVGVDGYIIFMIGGNDYIKITQDGVINLSSTSPATTPDAGSISIWNSLSNPYCYVNLPSAYLFNVSLTVNGGKAWQPGAGNLAAHTTDTTTLALNGVSVGDSVLITGPSIGIENGLIADGWASNINEVTIRVTNTTDAPIATASLNYYVTVFHAPQIPV